MAQMNWTEIEAFHNIRRFVKAYHEGILTDQTPLRTGPICYKSKIKLHGANGGLRVYTENGVRKVQGQSRQALIETESDNHGFGKIAFSVTPYLLNLSLPEDCTIFGEVAGPGVQRDVAASSIPNKQFFVFAIYVDGKLIVEPDAISAMLPNLPESMKILPWHSTVTIDWMDSEENLEVTVKQITADVMAVEAEDPYIKEIFGVSGIGEGLVFYPDTNDWSEYCNFVFKAKGEKHKTIGKAKPAQVNAEAAASIDEFVAMVLTPARLEQGKGQVSFTPKDTGNFINWIVKDVQKECSAELEASGLTFKQVESKVKEVARKFWLEELKKSAMSS